jgi:hypothetical protein
LRPAPHRRRGGFVENARASLAVERFFCFNVSTARFGVFFRKRSMSRRWLTIALFALALAVQALAPAAIGVAAAHEGGLSETCVTAADRAPQHAPPGTRHTHHHCALCQSFCDGVAPVPVRPIAVDAGPLHWRSFAWVAPVMAASPAWRDFAHRARAPPRFV